MFCYLFSGCTVLTTAPKLPATDLTEDCYDGMFNGCTSLTKAPELPAKTLTSKCYMDMFKGCIKLSSVTMLATDGLDSGGLVTWLGSIQTFTGTDEVHRAGREASSRILTLANETVYNSIISENALPDIWQKDANGTTVNYIDNSSPSTEGGEGTGE